MYISILDKLIKFNKIFSKGEFNDLISNDETKVILLNESIKDGDLFLVTLYDISDEILKIGIISQGFGFEPCALLIPSSKKIFIGYDSNFAIINYETKILEGALELDSVFFRFIHLPDKKLIITMHELGLLVLNESGEQLWKHDTDIITDFNINENAITLECMDSPKIKLLLVDGKQVN